MKTIIFSVLLATSVIAHPKEFKDDIPDCNEQVCQPPNCICSKILSPIGQDIPQFVMLSFDDSAVNASLNEYYEPLFFNRKNMDGCSISGTFFVPHEYTDYEVVNKLYNHGFEIGSHSITKTPMVDYWKNVNADTVISEMDGQRTILSKFANIPKQQITGARIPLFQYNSITLKALKEANFLYDNSWPTFQTYQWFPYTLDYKSNQQCHVDSCQTSSNEGLWEVPIIDWIDMKNIACNKLLGCVANGTVDELFEWMKQNFDATYKGNKAPFSIIINSAWFSVVSNGFKALESFLDYLNSLNDVFIVSERQVIEWMKNPTFATNYVSCTFQKLAQAPCKPTTCKLNKSDDDVRYMRSCVPCPSKYPWLNNPEGN